MRRFRLSTMLLLIVIAGLVCALVVQERRAAIDQVRLHNELQKMRWQVALLEAVRARNEKLYRSAREKRGNGGAGQTSAVQTSAPLASDPVEEGSPQ